MKLKPLKNKIVVKEVEITKETESGIIIPDSSKNLLYGKILSVGKEVDSVKEGTVVLFSGGVEVDEVEQIWVITEDNIFGILE